jgi:ubiquinone/menaquinone biosynthesis C-methylase UbiE
MGYEWTISRAVAEVVAPLLESVGLSGAVLDVGCGGGRLARHIAERNATRVIGVDPSTAQLRRVARSVSSSGAVLPVQASALGLPFAGASFDAVVSSCALKHWPDPVECVGECVRVARPGAPVVIVEINGDSPTEDIERFARRTRIPPGLRGAYVRFARRTVVGVAPSTEHFTDILRRGGLSDPRVSQVSGLPFNFAVANTP